MLHLVRNKLPTSFDRAFIVTFFFVTVAAGLFWLDFFRSYKAEVSVLIVSQSGANQVSEDVVANMAELSRTLSFYNRLLADNDLIDDDFVGYAPDKRKEHWHDLVSVRKQDESGVLVIRAVGDTPEKVKRLSFQTARTMFAIAGLYYNVKTDVDMRIVDGPFVSYTLEKPFLYGGVSFLTSLSLTAIFFFLLRTVPEIVNRKKESLVLTAPYAAPEKSNLGETTRHAYPQFDPSESVPWIDPRKFMPEKPQALSFESQFPDTEMMYRVPQVKHAEAPMNLPTAHDGMDLPVADEASLPFTFETIPEEVEESFLKPQDDTVILTREEMISTPVPTVDLPKSEPTQEEYRRRLNDLLANAGK